MPASLPIDDVLPALREALATHPSAVLQAPPGAGKTTRVPLALLAAPWLAGRRIVMLEPRRLATRMAARYMASLLGEEPGGTVGFRVRRETRVGRTTRIEVVTEGILGRMLQHDPSLDGVGLLIFDEFHERSLDADLGLALALQAQELLRDDLRLLVMSATLDGAAVSRLLGAAPVISSEGRSFEVETRYVPPRAGARLEQAVAGVVRTALGAHAGDVLVFLPGAAEIRRTHEALAVGDLAPATDVMPLFGNLSYADQDRAVRPSPVGRRKVVLATSIAETSLTIEGVRVVVDAGLTRVPRFSPRTGMTSLETIRVSRAGADQRRGRAGRVAPGTCYRLWAAEEQTHLVDRTSPEILSADLAPLALDLAAAGIADPLVLRWLDPPPAAAFAQARELLVELEALGSDGRITAHGLRMAEMPMHPRLAHMVHRAAERGAAALACDLAALLGERDLLRAEAGPPDADLRLRLEVLRDARAGRMPPSVAGFAVDRDAVRRVLDESRAVAEQLRRIAPRPTHEFTRASDRSSAGAPGESRADTTDVDEAGLLLAFAYPDRIARRREGGAGRYQLRNGSGAAFAAPQPLAREPFLVVPALDGQRPESRIYLAAPLDPDALEEYFGGQIENEQIIAWDDDAHAVVARERSCLGAIVLTERPIRVADPELVRQKLLQVLAARGIDALPWTDAARALRARLRFAHLLAPEEWPDVSDDALRDTLDSWLGPHLYGVRTLAEVGRAELGPALLGLVPHGRRGALDGLAPTHIQVPSGSRIPVDYSDPAAPALAVRLQEMFGLQETPTVGRGRVPLTLHLLSPAHRPVQVTRDLAGFWKSAYFDVRRDLRGRYPKHYWPDDPLEAEPTARAKRRER